MKTDHHPLCGIYVDMGTTNTRAWLMQDQEIVAFSRAPAGVADSARTGSREKVSQALKQLLEEVSHGQSQKPSFCIAAGMITSSLGLMEIPHLTAPGGEPELAAGLRRCHFPDITDLPFFLVPGLRCGDWNELIPPMSVDLMRGEETLCLGLLQKGILTPNSTLLNLGSHWKAISLDQQGRIASSISSLAGELLLAAQTQTILASSVPQSWPEHLDPQWIEAGMNEQTQSGLARALYCVRLLGQGAPTRPEERFAFLCGAFIGADLERLLSRQVFKPHSRVIITGSKSLGMAWQHALARHSVRSLLLTETERENGFLSGLHTFAASLFKPASSARLSAYVEPMSA